MTTRIGAMLVTCALAATASSQTPAPTDVKPDDAKLQGPLAKLAWLSGCFRGTANQREFREHWLPLRGDLLVGASHTVTQGRTQDFSHMRIEPRTDGVFFVVTPARQPEIAFRLTGEESDGPDRIYTFTNAATSFPQRLVYRRGSEGWMYVHVEGQLNNEERKVIYPMRRIVCETGELIR
ncbi:MAG TPA: DUF6265 family protein [Casimicrobiaceae bacterium]|nr:DUF6265 family protein [Casimicrobiaceae bacterium]